jgi:SAM-dependent methyltransferase
MTLQRRAGHWMARCYLWAAHRLYNELAFLYDPVSWLVSMGRWAIWRRVALDYVEGPRVLEVGFGTGELLLELAGRGLAVCGLEPSRAMHRVTARKLAKRGIEAPRLRGLTQSLPIANACLDTVVSTFPAEYILDPATMREVARVLRLPGHAASGPAGRLVVVGLVAYAVRPIRTPRYELAPPHDPILERFREVASAAGLAVRCSSRFDRRTRLPVLIAERVS